jgi:phosphatidylinositol alpha-1,6-mannosyltransferase
VADPVILAVSRLDPREPYKGIELLLRAVALARADEPALRLRIVGDGADRDRLRGVSRALGLDDAVVFTGSLDDKALRTEYERCRIFALPSTREGFGLVFLEAMAHGKPCVGVRAGAVPELVDSDSGLLAPPTTLPRWRRRCSPPCDARGTPRGSARGPGAFPFLPSASVWRRPTEPWLHPWKTC